MAFDFENNIDTSNTSVDLISLTDVYSVYQAALNQIHLDLVTSNDDPYCLKIVYDEDAPITAELPGGGFSILFFTLYKACPFYINEFDFDVDSLKNLIFQYNMESIYEYMFLYQIQQYFTDYATMHVSKQKCIIKNVDIVAVLSYCKFISKIFQKWNNKNIGPTCILSFYKSVEYGSRCIYPYLCILTQNQILQFFCTAYANIVSFDHLSLNAESVNDLIKSIKARWKYQITSYNVEKLKWDERYKKKYNFTNFIYNVFHELKDNGIIPKDYSKYVLSI